MERNEKYKSLTIMTNYLNTIMEKSNLLVKLREYRSIIFLYWMIFY
ncbi:hypothetical protein XNC1_1238 [Xenorhabdus nematophila ATCC 19061]|uniref:Uncharacterized protein n=1 Tax=Xenorhabdus nematophila (strain ATCC 19061 / DSM 3370 / CCUG 14189 / LMG 1036 / NCIMB 9965 / AN6) TaxID=406817 RepID=D3V9S1_XENNA|nr:hypothetical protein XNC1_1238 [Xenorhabdus nematophila ATCC 19061]CEK22210.1 hypothetical protein XNC2_1214 [Xenorhabdus nematophila AN6/1]